MLLVSVDADVKSVADTMKQGEMSSSETRESVKGMEKTRVYF